MFRWIAAGINLLGRRATVSYNGELQAVEMIMLATERLSFEAGLPARHRRTSGVT